VRYFLACKLLQLEISARFLLLLVVLPWYLPRIVPVHPLLAAVCWRCHTPIMTSEIPQRSPAWFALRKNKVTASNIAALLGLCKYTSQSKAIERARGNDTFLGNLATEWGTFNEPMAIRAYEDYTHNMVQETGAHVHPEHGWLLGSPDGLVQSDGIIEVKCPFYRRKHPTTGEKNQRVHLELPHHYYLQCITNIEVTGRKWCDYISWAPEGMVIWRIPSNPKLMEVIMERCKPIYDVIKSDTTCPRSCPSWDIAQLAQRNRMQEYIVAQIVVGVEGINKHHWPHASIPRPDESSLS